MCQLHNTNSGIGANVALDSFRLPKNVVPTDYEIKLFPNPTGKTGRFRGEETIAVTVKEATNIVALNVCEITIQKARITSGRKSIKGTVSVNKETEVATISFDRQIGTGNWKLRLSFTGSHNQGLRGFYKSTWDDEAGKTHVIVTTQHEATEARKSFPCFDEPEFKATFKVSLVIDKNLVGLSNGRRLSEKSLSRRRKLVEFARTPKMSTYLTCFIVGEFESSEPVFVNGKEIRIWCVPGKKNMTSWALKCAERGISWFEDYFGVPYFGGDKIDHVAIPDFEAGAMENTGCVTYREEALLCDEATASHDELESIAVTVLHEESHFWFGDLVTMFWWNGLWLNESFATFMENLCLAMWKPEWKIWDGFGATRAAALRIDGLKSTHPIEMPVNHPDEVDELFDAISYNKGGSVLDMIHQYIGFETFRQGISIYLKRHSLGNTQTGDLWDALEEACRANGSDIPVRRIMDAWVFTPGHPVVSVEQGSKPGTINVTQQQFQFLGEEQSTSLWPIPLIIKAKNAAGEETKQTVLFDTASATIEIGEGFQWVKVNAGGSGVYRVRYASDLALKLTANVQENLSVIERYNLVNDAWACVRAGLSTSIEFLQMVPLFAGETDPTVFGILLGGLSALHRILPEEDRQPLKDIIRNLCKPTFDLLGWTPVAGESVQTTQLRASLFSTLGRICEDTEVRAKSEELFASWLKDKSSIDPNLVGVVVDILSYFGDEARYEEFKKLLKTVKTPNEQNIFLSSLSGFRQLELLKRTLELSLTDEVSVQDSPYVFASLLGNKYSQVFAWDYLRANWEKVKTTFPTNMVPGIARSCVSLDTPEKAAEVQAFFAANEVKAGAMAVAQMLEQLSISVRLRESETTRLLAYLAAK
jgi:puromycin-sensitive aminopeptidase